MKKFERIIVALDHTDFDQQLLKYFSLFSKTIFPKKVYFIYVDQNLEKTSDLEIAYKDENGQLVPKDELLKKVLTIQVNEHFANKAEVDFEVEVLEGSPLEQILHWTKVKNADLLVLGNKKFSEGSGVVAKRVARNTDCAVLFVPETSNSFPHHILVPVDFSKYSELAMNGALELAKVGANTEITAFNVFDVPMTGYPMVNMNYERFVKNMASFKKEAFEEYIQKFDLGTIQVHADYVENDTNNVAKHIHRYAHQHNFDLIVMGAKGHSLFDRMLMGSVTEKLVSYDKEIPLLILRNQAK